MSGSLRQAAERVARRWLSLPRVTHRDPDGGYDIDQADTGFHYHVSPEGEGWELTLRASSGRTVEWMGTFPSEQKVMDVIRYDLENAI